MRARVGVSARMRPIQEIKIMPDMVGIILAAGKGTRMKSKLPKALHPICGKPISRYVIDACRESGIGDCVVVIGHGADQVRAGLGDDVRYAIQSQQLGTGDACKRAIEVLDGADGDVIVLPGDAPMIGADILKKLSGEHAASGAAATVLTAVLDDARQYGRVIRGADRNVERIVEAKDASPEELKVGEINAAVYCFNLALLRKYLGEITPANAQGEYYLTDVIGLMVRDGLTVGAVVSDDPNVVLGINDRVDLAHLAGLIRRNILEKLMVGGVTVVDPSSTYVDADVVVGADTVIHPQTYIEKGCKIGEGCVIGPSSRLVNVELGNEITVLFSNLTDSTFGDGTRVGPFANIRPGCRIGRKVKLGDFVEAKNSVLEDGVSMGHLSYIGDATIGERTNVGAGTITCNYDGYNKFKTIIGKNVFLGSSTTMVAPVEIGDGALTAAGSVITDNVPADALVIARSKQIVKEQWARLRREQKEKA